MFRCCRCCCCCALLLVNRQQVLLPPTPNSPLILLYLFIFVFICACAPVRVRACVHVLVYVCVRDNLQSSCWLFNTSASFFSVAILHSQIGEQSYYDILGVNQNVKLKQLKKAYRRSATKVHPDKIAAKSPPDDKKEAAELEKGVFFACASSSVPHAYGYCCYVSLLFRSWSRECLNFDGSELV